MAHQLPFRAYPLKKHDELQFEEHDRINGGTAFACIGFVNEFSYERQIECSLQMSIKMICWNQVLQRDIDEWSKGSLSCSHHRSRLSFLTMICALSFLPPASS